MNRLPWAFLAALAAGFAATPGQAADAPESYYRYYEPPAPHHYRRHAPVEGEVIEERPVTIYERAYIPHPPDIAYPLPERFCRVTYRGWDGGRRLYGPRRVEICHDEW